jgi:hypothetical protein
VSDAKGMLSLANGRTERDIILLGLSYLLPPRLRIQIHGFQKLWSEIWRRSNSEFLREREIWHILPWLRSWGLELGLRFRRQGRGNKTLDIILYIMCQYKRASPGRWVAWDEFGPILFSFFIDVIVWN